jgi:hypothetical protein
MSGEIRQVVRQQRGDRYQHSDRRFPPRAGRLDPLSTGYLHSSASVRPRDGGSLAACTARFPDPAHARPAIRMSGGVNTTPKPVRR